MKDIDQTFTKSVCSLCARIYRHIHHLLGGTFVKAKRQCVCTSSAICCCQKADMIYSRIFQ